MSTPEPLAYFAAHVRRALARATAAPELLAVEPLVDRGWRLSFRLADARAGEPTVEVSAIARDDDFDYAYIPAPADLPRRVHLDRVGHLLCQALGKCPSKGERPALVASPSEDEPEPPRRESMSFWLISDCDRSCEFCPVSLQTEAERASRRLSILGNTSVSFAAIESQLRANAPRAADIAIEWSGKDCLAAPDFEPGVRLAHDLGYREMGIQSPGTRLADPEFVEFLRAHSITHVGLTAHAGDAQTFDRSGGKAGAYELFWRSLDNVLAAGFDVALEVPCTARTVDGLAGHLARLASHPVSITVFFIYTSPEMDDQFPRLGVTYDRAIAALQAAAERVPARRVAINGIPECVRPTQLEDHYFWSYADNHMVFLDFVRVPACEACGAQERCPGPTPVYLRYHPWPGEPVPRAS